MQHIIISQLSIFFNTFWNKPKWYFHLLSWFLLFPNLFIPSIFLYHEKCLRYIIDNPSSIFNYCFLHVLDCFVYSFSWCPCFIIRNILKVAIEIYCKNFAAKNHLFCFVLLPLKFSLSEFLIIVRILDLVVWSDFVWHSRSSYLRNWLICFSILQLLILKRVLKPLNCNKLQA